MVDPKRSLGLLGLFGYLLVALDGLRVVLELPTIRSILALANFGQAVDFALDHWKHPGWLGNPWAQFAIFVVGVVLIILERKGAIWIPLPSVKPRPMIIGGLVIILIGAAVVGIGIYRLPNNTAASAPSPFVINVPPAPSAVVPSAPPVSTTLIPNKIPLPSGTAAESLARYVQIREAINQAKTAKKNLQGSSEVLLHIMKAGTDFSGPASYEMGNQTTWEASSNRLEEINNHLYENRKIDIHSVPELANPIAKAPDEAVFGDDFDRAYKYRSFYFLNKNIQKQADALIDDMEKELNSLSKLIVDTPAGKIVR